MALVFSTPWACSSSLGTRSQVEFPMLRVEEKSGVNLSLYKGLKLPKRNAISNREHRLGVMHCVCTRGALQLSTGQLYAHAALLNVFILQPQAVLYIGWINSHFRHVLSPCVIYPSSLHNFDLPANLTIRVQPCSVHSLANGIHGVQAIDNYGNRMCCRPEQ